MILWLAYRPPEADGAPIIELREGKINDIPRENNVARGPRRTNPILKIPLAFQPTPLFFDDNAVAATV